MINYKSVRWSLGIILSLGLSACYWNGQRAEYVDTHYEHIKGQKQAAELEGHSKRVQKTYASKDPTQKSTPGPVRKTAPQLPVIQ